MTITPDRRELYPSLTDQERWAVDRAFLAVQETLADYDLSVARLGNDDCAENLVGAIARYVVDSR